MLKSPKIYTSWLSKFGVLRIAVESLSRNPDWSGGRYTFPIKIGLVFGKSISTNIFSISVEKCSL